VFLTKKYRVILEELNRDAIVLRQRVDKIVGALTDVDRRLQVVGEEVMRISQQVTGRAAIEERYHNLVQQVMSMKEKGFSPPAFLQMQPSDEDALPKEVLDAIYVIAPPGNPYHHQQVRQAWVLKNQGMGTAEIVDALHKGENPDELLDA
jgi:hypothetical protein